MLKIFNSLTRKVEEFKPINPSQVGMYTCGPTVYHYATIGNLRTYTTGDLLLRVLQYNGYKVKYIMNLTDVGHLTGDNEGDADTGEDRLEKAAKRERKTAWEVADFYIQVFFLDFEKLNLTKPEMFCRATDHIQEQIDLVKKLAKKGLTYKTSDGVYFDTVSFETKTGKKYGELSTLDQIKEGARVEPNPEKKNPRDFALWKFSPQGEKRDMEWECEFGKGFPGWHIECSAMSMKYLGETFDLHVGGEDLRSTHHPNEIAQSEGATNKKFVNYWLHGAFLKIDGGRMGKSVGNAYSLTDVQNKGFEPLALRYLYLTGKYRDSLNFTWEALEGAQNTLNNLREQIRALRKQDNQRTVLSEEKRAQTDEFSQQFIEAINNDLNLPQALAVVWNMLKSNIPSEDKLDLLLSFDEVLGLQLAEVTEVSFEIPKEIKDLAGQRETLRKEGKFEEADQIRVKMEERGFVIKDTTDGTMIVPANERKIASS